MNDTKNVHPFHIIFSIEQWERLGALSRHLDLSRAATIRWLLRCEDPAAIVEKAMTGRIGSARAMQLAAHEKLERRPATAPERHWEPDEP